MKSDPTKAIQQLIERTKGMRPAERQSFVDKLNRENPELANEATAMFSLHEEGVLEENSTSDWFTSDYNDDAVKREVGIGSVIGPFTLISQLGEGGMGTVYLAEQTKPVNRKVALKFLHINEGNEQQISLLVSEIQALALMNHSFIAKVFDTGLTTEGSPWFAMEWVKGEPITSYCDRYVLSIRERLKLFSKVCTGIQHAHMRGIIHRDIKPANILVSMEEGDPTPKIIDFGVAKSIDQGNPQLRLIRRDDGIAGTPTYMSPEQVCNPAEVDTRTDVYSLGLLLFELMVGVQPFIMGETSFFSIIHRVVNGDIPEPTIYFGQLGEEAEGIAQSRNLRIAGLLRVLKGDLSSIVVKALAKERDDRYESVADFSQDIKRWLDGEAVLAHDGSGFYRLKKFIQRHRVGTVAAIISGLSLAVGLSFSAFHYVQTIQAKELAAREATKAWSINQFLTDMLASADPDLYGADVKVVDVLDMASVDLDEAFDENPEVEARLRETIGETYSQLGQLKKAERESSKAVSLTKAYFGENHLETLKARGLYGLVMSREGKYSEAELELTEVLLQLNSIENRDIKETQKTMIHLAMAKANVGKADEARALLAGLEAELVKKEPVDYSVLLTVQNNLAQVLVKDKEFESAATLLVQVHDKRVEMVGAEHPRSLTALNNLALVYEKMGKREKAISLQREVLEKRTEILGPEHPQTLHSMDNLAISLMRTRAFEESGVLLETSLRMRKNTFGPRHSKTLKTQRTCIVNALGLKDYQLAQMLSKDYLEKCIEVYGVSHAKTLFAQTSLGMCYDNMKQYQKAFEIYRQASRAASQVFPVEHPQVIALNAQVGKSLVHLKRYAEAEPVLIHCLEAYNEKRGEGNRYSIRILHALIGLYHDWGKTDKAKEYQRMATGFEKKD